MDAGYDQKIKQIRYQRIISTIMIGMYADNAAPAIEITVTPIYCSATIKPANKAVVSTAFVICLPMIVAKKNVYSPPIMGFTVASNAPTTSFSAPVRIIRTNRQSKITGAYVTMPSGR